ncbi:MAG TPA: RNA polymerase sigma factor [Chitinophagaceae bacterium]
MNDWILINRLKQGDQAAFKEIVETWQDMVYNTAIGIVQNSEDAEDVAQDVFVQVYQSIDGFKGNSKFSTWLYRITISKAMDHERRKKRKKRFALIKSIFGEDSEVSVDVPDFNPPGVLFDRKEKAAVLFKEMAKLPENQRIAFVLNKVEGLSYQEISEIMDTTVPAVESLLHRAKSNLRKWLKDFYERQ